MFTVCIKIMQNFPEKPLKLLQFFIAFALVSSAAITEGISYILNLDQTHIFRKF